MRHISYICAMEDTRQKIIDSTIITLNNDFSATFETIADVAGISRRTLHRYFTDRNQLLDACKDEMNAFCNTSMIQAYNSSKDSLVRLERMLYATIDCGSKYSFLNKLYSRTTYTDAEKNSKSLAGDNVKKKWFAIVNKLQSEGIISNKLSAAWIFIFFGGIVDMTITGVCSGDIARNEIKKFAWFSFSNGLGIKKHNND